MKPSMPVAIFRQGSGMRQRGAGLVELLVSITIGLFLMTAVAAVYLSANSATRSSSLEAQLNEEGSLALQILQQQIKMAGYSGTNASGGRNFQGIAVRGCAGGFNDYSADFASIACSGTGQDALAIRFEADILNTAPVTVSGVNQPTNCLFNGISNWATSDAGTGTYAQSDNRYYVKNDSDGIPNLYCRGREGTGGFGTEQPLIANIEGMSITYIVTKAPVTDQAMPHQITAYVKADNAVLGNTQANWARVAGVHICLLARSAEPVPITNSSNNDVGTYIDCAGTTVTASDRYLRRAFQTTVQFRNLRSAIPAPVGTTGGPWAALSSTP